jgi:tRNA (mo5U34)-methyltransferase
MDPAELRSRVEELEWFHSIDLGGGVVTPGRDDSAAKLARLRLPADLSGRSVLDIGAWDGFFSFEAERRRAERVLAVDTLAWERGEKSGRPCFELAHRALGSRVESRRLDVHDVATAGIGRFDLVLCLGVLYHLREPLRALEAVAAVTGELLVLETATDATHLRRPAMVWYPEDELAGDPSNWVGPNEALLECWLRDVGFREVRVVHRRPRAARLARAIAWGGGRPWRWPALYDQGRVVVHARR